MELKDLKLNMESITGRRGAVAVISVRPRYVRDANGKATNTLEGYNVDIPALGSSLQTVKLPSGIKKTVEQAQNALQEGNIVLAEFSQFKATAYALLDGARLRSGVSATAEGMSIRIVPIDKNNEDDEEEFETL